MEIMDGTYTRLTVENVKTGETIAVVTDESIETAKDIVVKLTPIENA